MNEIIKFSVTDNVVMFPYRQENIDWHFDSFAESLLAAS